jgi:hypothetical protein
VTDNDLMIARLDLAERMAWLDRNKASGRVLQPTDTKGWIYDGLLTGYAHDDSVEVPLEGPVRVMPVSERSRNEWVASNTLYDGPGGKYAALIDVYWDVEPVGWTPRCPKTGEALTSCWVFGPSVYLER